MKQLFTFFFSALVISSAFAQQTPPPSPGQPSHESVIGVHTGFSWIGIFTGLADRYNVIADVSASASPVIGVSYDYKIIPRISVGGSIARQAFSLRYRNYTYEDGQGNQQTDNFRTDLSRLNISVRGLVHYFRSPRAEMYSGLRLGISNWSLNTTARDPAYEVADYLNYALSATPSFQLILFGFRGYFTPHLGGNIETAIGAPHFISFGLVYRL